ncbi:MAG: Fe-S cluster assembly ATPase SufC [Mycoplasmataceae bacterium]|jgi:Fe-S cluster assembly ATP-binding protein|nr:Fe-S cluster assembly ATPase SufC [Mycoplasmataceae bacterium]
MKFNIKNLNVNLDEKPFLKNISLSISKPEIILLMGNNGQGKTTLLKTIMNHYSTKIVSGEIKFNNTEISSLNTYEIAKQGILYIPQTPLEFDSIQTMSFLKNINEVNKKLSFSELYSHIKNFMLKYDLPEELLTRFLNNDFSGGQKKKMELLQASIIDPELYLIDEIDSGVDFDSLKKIAQYINSLKKKKIFIIVSHNYEFIKLIKPQQIIIIDKGKIIKKGGYALINKVKKEGINSFLKSNIKTKDNVCFFIEKPTKASKK